MRSATQERFTTMAIFEFEYSKEFQTPAQQNLRKFTAPILQKRWQATGEHVNYHAIKKWMSR